MAPCLVYCLVGRMEWFCFRVWLKGLNQIADQLIPLTMGPTLRPLSLGTSPRAPVHRCCSVRARRVCGCFQRCCLGCCRLPRGRVRRCPSRAAAASERETVRNTVKKGQTRSAFSRERAEPESCRNILTLECPHPWVLEPITGKSRMEWFHPISSHEPNTSYMFFPHQL